MIDPQIARWLIAACVAVILGGTINMDDLGPDDARAEWDQSTALQDAIKTEAAEARFTRAADEMCGNSWWTVDVDGVVHCVGRQVRGPGVVLTNMASVGVQP